MKKTEKKLNSHNNCRIYACSSNFEQLWQCNSHQQQQILVSACMSFTQSLGFLLLFLQVSKMPATGTATAGQPVTDAGEGEKSIMLILLIIIIIIF